MTSDSRDDQSSTWTPTPEFIATTNIAWLMQRAGALSYEALHAWSVQNRAAFWDCAIERLGIRFDCRFSDVLDMTKGVESARWLVGARMNIVDSCFAAAPETPAIIHQAEGKDLRTTTIAQLASLTERVAANLAARGFKPGAAIAMIMPMTMEAVAIYLGIIKAGCVVVGIADSFRPKEIAARLRIAQAAAVFTQDIMRRGGKTLPLYANIVAANPPPVIVLPADERIALPLRDGDCEWAAFLQNSARFATAIREPDDPTNILFSSGTTGEPKAIPWTQATPIKCAADAHFHQNIQPGDVLVWPTSVGWMMGPWLIFASLINRATMGIFDGAPTGRDFGRFVQDTKATMLGVVPTLVKAWRTTNCMAGHDWSAIKVFSSTGECSSADDMRWLMAQAGGKPVVEYCGGTEIGGGYITNTVTLPCTAGAFNTPALGLDFVLLDDNGQSADTGELFLIPPSIGLSQSLLNRDHHELYFAAAPRGPHGETLRRHGDQMTRLPNGDSRALGRADDTMNLGGIKVSSAEIEQVLNSIPHVVETAAIAVAPTDGPSLLVIYAVCAPAMPCDRSALLTMMQAAIRRDLNPHFKIHDLVLVDTLPRTASNKMIRRALREQYLCGKIRT